jgi:hypothetical protein
VCEGRGKGSGGEILRNSEYAINGVLVDVFNNIVIVLN